MLGTALPPGHRLPTVRRCGSSIDRYRGGRVSEPAVVHDSGGRSLVDDVTRAGAAGCQRLRCRRGEHARRVAETAGEKSAAHGHEVWSNNGAAGPHLDRGDAPSVQDDEPVAMPGPKDTVVLAEGRDHVIDHLGFADVVGSLKRHVYLFATNEPYA